MSEYLQIDPKKFRASAGLKTQKINDAKNSEQRQSVSAVQSCPNKRWIDLYYKYPSDRPVSGAAFTISDASGREITSGKLDQRGFAHVTNLPDSLSSVQIIYSGDPKPFEIFKDKKPFKNPYLDMPAKPPVVEPSLAIQGAVKVVQMYLAYENLKMMAAEWTWDAIQGDWNDGQTLGQIVFDSAVSMIPVVDQAADVRDLAANIYKLAIEKKYDEFGPWMGFVMTLIGVVPEVGTAIKGAVKSVIKVGKNAATAVIKRGVKFGELLIVKSGIDIGALIRFMNSFGEGNVVRWLRHRVDRFGELKKFVKDKAGEILLAIKKKCLEVKERLFEAGAKKLESIANSIDDVMRRVETYVEEIMERGRKELDDVTKKAEDYSIPGTTFKENGAKQIATPDQLPKPEPVKSHPKAKRIDMEQVRKIAADAGMEPEELLGLIEHCNKNNRRVVVRFTNPHNLKWHGKPNHVPKNVDVKLQTAKSGENAGLVIKPKEPMEDWEIENIDALKAKGYEFDGANRLVDNKGNRIYGDYDLQSVHSVDPHTGASTDLLSNPESGSVITEINGGMGRKDREMLEQRSPVQHGAENDFYVKTKQVPKKDRSGNIVMGADGKPVMTREPVYKDPAREKDTLFDPKSGQVRDADAKGKLEIATKENIESGNAMLGRQHGDDEKYLVINPDNTTEVLENPHELYQMNQKNGLPWKYEAKPPTGEELAAEQAKRAEKQRVYANMAATEAIAEKVQMERFIDDIIGDGKQIWETPSDYVRIGATPF